MQAAKIHAARASSPKHKIALQWFASLTNAVETGTTGSDANRWGTSLKRAVEFYALYVETNEERYLRLCEEFLRDSLSK